MAKHTVTGHNFKDKGKELHTKSTTPTVGTIDGTNLADCFVVFIQGTARQWIGKITTKVSQTGATETWNAKVSLFSKPETANLQSGTDNVTVTVTNPDTGDNSSAADNSTVID